MEQTTLLLSKEFESSLRWKIKNFADYSDCGVNVLTSETVYVEGANAYWSIDVYLNENNVTIELKIIDDDDMLEKHHYKSLLGSIGANQASDKYIWKTDYEKMANDGVKTYKKTIKTEKLSSYVNGESLTLFAQVWLKRVTLSARLSL